MANKYIYAIWRRKTATAQVRLFEGTGNSTINGRDFSSYITRPDLFDIALAPIKLCSLKDKVFFEVKVDGSWISAQVQAIRHGLSRALASNFVSSRASSYSNGWEVVWAAIAPYSYNLETGESRPRRFYVVSSIFDEVNSDFKGKGNITINL